MKIDRIVWKGHMFNYNIDGLGWAVKNQSIIFICVALILWDGNTLLQIIILTEKWNEIYWNLMNYTYNPYVNLIKMHWLYTAEIQISLPLTSILLWLNYVKYYQIISLVNQIHSKGFVPVKILHEVYRGDSLWYYWLKFEVPCAFKMKLLFMDWSYYSLTILIK